MNDWSMDSILDRLRRLGPDWHRRLADEMTDEERELIAEAIEDRGRAVDPFVLIVTDRDAMTFSVEGPMVDDDPWSAPVVAAQREGRQVAGHVPGEPARSDVETAARVYAAEYPEMRRVPAGTIVALR